MVICEFIIWNSKKYSIHTTEIIIPFLLKFKQISDRYYFEIPSHLLNHVISYYIYLYYFILDICLIIYLFTCRLFPISSL